MASSTSDIRQLERTLSTLLNKQLQQICSTHGLKTSGVKAELQGRIKNGKFTIPTYLHLPMLPIHISSGAFESQTVGQITTCINLPSPYDFPSRPFGVAYLFFKKAGL
jgi:hypothetical protein